MSRQAILAISLAFAAVLIWQAAKMWFADRLVNSQQLERMDRGAKLEPDNAEAWDRLGRKRQWDLANPDPQRSIEDFQNAVAKNPRSAHYWMDLAGAYENSGRDSQARQAFEKAVEVYPTSAEVAWYHGNFLLRQENYAQGFAEIRRAVETDPSLLPLAVSRSWRANHDVNLLLDRVLPASLEAYFQALDFFSSSHEGDAALAVWQRLIELGKPFAVAKAFPFLDELIREDRSADATRVWRQVLAAGGLTLNQPGGRSLVWNGDFARDFLNGGLDWRWSGPFGITIDFDSAPPATSGRSVRLDFGGGSNVDLSEPSEFVPVEPNRVYHFHARMKTEAISTESGMRFSIADPNHNPGVHELTEGFTGTHPWTAIDLDLSTNAETHFLVIRLRRAPSRLFENRLSGSISIADVSLTPATDGAEHSSP